jgi:hypothetical protein
MHTDALNFARRKRMKNDSSCKGGMFPRRRHCSFISRPPNTIQQSGQIGVIDVGDDLMREVVDRNRDIALCSSLTTSVRTLLIVSTRYQMRAIFMKRK